MLQRTLQWTFTSRTHNSTPFPSRRGHQADPDRRPPIGAPVNSPQGCERLRSRPSQRKLGSCDDRTSRGCLYRVMAGEKTGVEEPATSEYRQTGGGQQRAAVGFLVVQMCPGGVRRSHSGNVGEGSRGLPVWALQLFWKPKMISSIVQWLRIHLARKGMRVRSPVQERRSHMQLSPRHNKRCASPKT